MVKEAMAEPIVVGLAASTSLLRTPFCPVECSSQASLEPDPEVSNGDGVEDAQPVNPEGEHRFGRFPPPLIEFPPQRNQISGRGSEGTAEAYQANSKGSPSLQTGGFSPAEHSESNCALGEANSSQACCTVECSSQASPEPEPEVSNGDGVEDAQPVNPEGEHRFGRFPPPLIDFPPQRYYGALRNVREDHMLQHRQMVQGLMRCGSLLDVIRYADTVVENGEMLLEKIDAALWKASLYFKRECNFRD